MSLSSGHADNKAFPFRAYAVFNKGNPGSEDSVASVDFRLSEYMLRYSADVGRDDGTVLADGPAANIDISNGITSVSAEIRVAIFSIVQFLEESEQTVSDAMASVRD